MRYDKKTKGWSLFIWMNIGIDIRPFLRQETGVGVYGKNLLTALAGLDQENSYFLLSSSWKERFDRSALPPFRKLCFRDLRLPVFLLNNLWYRAAFPAFESFFAAPMDVIHSLVPALIPGQGQKVITVHDLSFLAEPGLAMPEAKRLYRRSLDRALRQSAAVICVSRTTATALSKQFGGDYAEKIHVIHHGCDLDGVSATPPAAPLPDNFVLFIGTLEPRKNLGVLLRALDHPQCRQAKINLVIAGRKGWEKPSFFAELQRHREWLTWLEYVSRPVLKYLYQRARLLVFPSLYEGFGLPILEAACCGLPVLASRLEVFAEIFADFPEYFAPEDAQELRSKMLSLLADDGLAARAAAKAKGIAATYTWTEAARQTLEVYRSLGA